VSRYTYFVSSLLALSGTGFAVAGTILGEYKPVMVGFFLILGSAVFAILFLGTRRALNSKPAPPLASISNHDRPPGPLP
jgi:hypothetical protein